MWRSCSNITTQGKQDIEEAGGKRQRPVEQIKTMQPFSYGRNMCSDKVCLQLKKCPTAYLLAAIWLAFLVGTFACLFGCEPELFLDGGVSTTLDFFRTGSVCKISFFSWDSARSLTSKVVSPKETSFLIWGCGDNILKNITVLISCSWIHMTIFPPPGTAMLDIIWKEAY